MNMEKNLSPMLGKYVFLGLWGLNCVSFGEYKSLKMELEQEQEKNANLQLQLGGKTKELRAVSLSRQSLISSRALTEQEKERYSEIVEKLKKSVQAHTFKLRISGGRVVLILPADILFESGSAVVSKRGNRAIEELTHILKAHPNCKYQIEGHTDNIPIHTPRFPSNWELASARALGVLHTMVAAGMPPDLLSSASFADTRPLKSNENEEGRQANRRIEIALIPDLSLLPIKKEGEGPAN